MEEIQIKQLTKSYGKTRGINDINLNIEKGQIFGFIGPNGAGKSTTIKCIMNLINKNLGEIYIDNELVSKKNYKIKEFIGYLPAEVHLYDDLIVKKMLNYSASFYKKDCTKRIEELVKKLDIDLNKKIDELSLGNLKKVGIVLALMHEPKLVIMDEATSGLDPLMQEAFYEIIEEEKQKGTTIFFSSHILGEIKRICEKVAIIKNGKIVKVTEVDKLINTNVLKIDIISENIDKIKKIPDIEIKEQLKNEIKFIYRGDINTLIKHLEKYNILKILIEEPSIEEVVIQYYE